MHGVQQSRPWSFASERSLMALSHRSVACAKFFLDVRMRKAITNLSIHLRIVYHRQAPCSTLLV